MHPKKFLFMALLIAAFAVVSQDYHGQAVAQPGGFIIMVTAPSCDAPVQISDCARHCSDNETCLVCCNDGWPSFAQHQAYLACRTRCNDLHPPTVPG